VFHAGDAAMRAEIHNIREIGSLNRPPIQNTLWQSCSHKRALAVEAESPRYDYQIHSVQYLPIR
jgi:hypothetical protein